MKKELSEMTLEELWELFPIFLVPYDDKWDANYKEIEMLISSVLPIEHVIRISHIGSTAIKGIYSKNIVDVLVEISDDIELTKISNILEQNGFIKMSEEEKRISLNKGYTKDGFANKVYHVHLRYSNDNDELYFRDYLREYPNIAKEYETLNLSLWKKYEHNRNAYTEAKTDFVRHYTKEARKKYEERY